MYDNINIDVIHSDRPQEQRDAVIKKFRTGQIWVLICTELLGRGIDFKGVNLVINYDFPVSAVSYIHRIGKHCLIFFFFVQRQLSHSIVVKHFFFRNAPRNIKIIISDSK